MDARQTVTALAALAHEHRLGLFRLLVQRGPEGVSAGMIAERLGITPTALSFHLQQLMHAGLITQRRLGRRLIYAANYQAMRGLIVYLTKNCCTESALPTAEHAAAAVTTTPSVRRRRPPARA